MRFPVPVFTVALLFCFGIPAHAQTHTSEFASWTVLTNVIPWDDTVPLATEGTEILSVTITPQKSALRITGNIKATPREDDQGCVATLVVDGQVVDVGASMVASQWYAMSPIVIDRVVSVTPSQPVTVSVRAGPRRVVGTSSECWMNGHWVNRLFGGESRSTLIVQEVDLSTQTPEAVPETLVFVMAGQSNMSGRGPLSEMPPLNHGSRMISYRNSGAWGPATDPVDDATGEVYSVLADSTAAASPMRAFASRLAELRPLDWIAVVSCAKGDTSMLDWARSLSTDTLYGACIAQVQAALAARPGARLAGLIWYQGESDAFKSADQQAWPVRFTQLVSDFRSDFGSLPVVMTVLGPDSDAARFPFWCELVVTQQMMTLPGDTVRVSANDLESQPLDPPHLTTAGYVTIGQRMADAMDQLL